VCWLVHGISLNTVKIMILGGRVEVTFLIVGGKTQQCAEPGQAGNRIIESIAAALIGRAVQRFSGSKSSGRRPVAAMI
jgi:hypothetical protein